MGRREGGKGGWVAACARTRRGAGSCLRGEGWVGGWGRGLGVREDTGWARERGGEDGLADARGQRRRDGRGLHPILTFPPEGGREGRDGLADAQGHGTGGLARTRDGGAGEFAGGGMGFCMREDTGWGGFVFARTTGGEGWGWEARRATRFPDCAALRSE